MSSGKGVLRDFVIEWDGVPYTVTPSMTVLRQIESQGISIVNLVATADNGQPLFTHFAFVLWFFLIKAGVDPKDLDQGEIYRFLTSGQAEAQKVMFDIAAAIWPEPVDEKKPEARDSEPS